MSSPSTAVSTPELEHVGCLIDAEFSGMHGWMSPAKARRVAAIVVASSPTPKCVELGVFGAKGCVAIGLAIKHCLPGGTVDGIDPYTAAAALEGTNDKGNQDWWAALDYATILKSARAAITRLDLEKIVRLVLKRSQDAVGDYEDRSIDVLHQDSNHAEEVTCWEVANWTPKMRPGGFWVFDDTNWPSTKLAQERLITTHSFVLLEQYDTWAVFRAPT